MMMESLDVGYITMQQIGKWVVTHSKEDSNLHGQCFAISRKQCPFWILFMSQHLNPATASQIIANQ